MNSYNIHVTIIINKITTRIFEIPCTKPQSLLVNSRSPFNVFNICCYTVYLLQLPRVIEDQRTPLC